MTPTTHEELFMEIEFFYLFLGLASLFVFSFVIVEFGEALLATILSLQDLLVFTRFLVRINFGDHAFRC